MHEGKDEGIIPAIWPGNELCLAVYNIQKLLLAVLVFLIYDKTLLCFNHSSASLPTEYVPDTHSVDANLTDVDDSVSFRR